MRVRGDGGGGLAPPSTAPAACGNLDAFDQSTPAGEIDPFDIASNGALAAKSPASVPTVDDAVSRRDPDGRHLYVSALKPSASIGLFDVAADGTLSAKSPHRCRCRTAASASPPRPTARAFTSPTATAPRCLEFDIAGDGA